MGIFSGIKNAIFGDDDAAPAPRPAARPAAPAAAPAAPASTPAPAAPRAEVDVEAILEAKAAALGKPSNWRTSIVDLMILLGMDHSLANRKELAAELGYDGPLDGSADMNIRLHRAVMRALAVNGGKVPPQMMD